MTTKTKQDLLAKMSELGACPPAMKYVLAQPDDMMAEQIWLGCNRTGWLVWFAVRMTDIRPFAFGCADRAVRIYAADAMERVGQTKHAAALRALASVVDRPTALVAKKAAAYAVRAAANAAAYADAAAYAANAAADAGATAAAAARAPAARAAARARARRDRADAAAYAANAAAAYAAAAYADAAAYAANAAAAYAGANSAADAAAYAADAAAAYAAVESKIQLDQLHAMWSTLKEKL